MALGFEQETGVMSYTFAPNVHHFIHLLSYVCLRIRQKSG